MLYERYQRPTAARQTYPLTADASPETDPLWEQAMAMAYGAITANANSSDGGRMLAAERMEAAF